MGTAKNFMQAFIGSTIKTFEVQVGIVVKPGKHFIEKYDDRLASDISGIIGIMSRDFKGTLSLMFPEKVFLGIVSKMLMEEFSSISNENDSAAGELANIILGQAKRELNEKHGENIESALPSIVTGNDHVVRSMKTGQESFIVPILCEFGTFHVRISIEK